MAVIPFSPLYQEVITPLPVYPQVGSIGEMWHRNRDNCKSVTNFPVTISADNSNLYNEGYPIRFFAQGLSNLFVLVKAVNLNNYSEEIDLLNSAQQLKYAYCNDGYYCQITVPLDDIPCGEWFFKITTLADENFYSEVFNVYQKNENNTFGVYTLSKNIYDGYLDEEFCKIGRFDYIQVFNSVVGGSMTNYYFIMFMPIINGEQFHTVTEKEEEENEDGSIELLKVVTKYKYTLKTAPVAPFTVKALKVFEHIGECNVFVNDQLNSYGATKLLANEINVSSEPIDNSDTYYQATIEFVGDLVYDSRCCDDSCDGDIPCWSDGVQEEPCIYQVEGEDIYKRFYSTDPLSVCYAGLTSLFAIGELVESGGDYFMSIGNNYFAPPNTFFWNMQVSDGGGCTPVVQVIVPNNFPFVIVEISNNEVDWYYYTSGTANAIRNGISGTIPDEVTGNTLYIRVKIGFVIPEECQEISRANQVSETLGLNCEQGQGFDYLFDFKFTN